MRGYGMKLDSKLTLLTILLFFTLIMGSMANSQLQPHQSSNYIRNFGLIDEGYFVIHVEEDLLFASDAQSIVIYDVSDPSLPILLKTINAGNILDFAVNGDILYLFREYGSTEVYDITDPTNPVPWLNFGSGPRDAEVNAGYLYATGGADLQIFDLIDPIRPNKIYEITTNVTVNPLGLSVEVYEKMAAIAESEEGIYLFNVTDPANTEILSFIAPTLAKQMFTGVTFHPNGQILYVSDVNNLWAYDISDPEFPVLLDSVNTGGTLLDIGISLFSGLVVPGYRNESVRIYDIADFSDFTLLDEFFHDVVPPYTFLSYSTWGVESFHEFYDYMFVTTGFTGTFRYTASRSPEGVAPVIGWACTDTPTCLNNRQLSWSTQDDSWGNYWLYENDVIVQQGYIQKNSGSIDYFFAPDVQGSNSYRLEAEDIWGNKVTATTELNVSDPNSTRIISSKVENQINQGTTTTLTETIENTETLVNTVTDRMTESVTVTLVIEDTINTVTETETEPLILTTTHTVTTTESTSGVSAEGFDAPILTLPLLLSSIGLLVIVHRKIRKN